MNDPTFISLFSGIGGADLGFERAGFRCVAQVESHPWRRRILEHHWPDVPRFDDVCTVGAHNLPPASLIVGGFPCQDLSVAGKRRGLAGERSGLFYEFSRIIDELAPDWFCIENVPGLLSSDPAPSNRGGDFGLVLLELTGYPPDIPKDGWRNSGVCAGPKRTVAWRVLDSRYFGVAQRRRRVFIVGGPGASSGFEVLFESEGGNGNPEEGEATGEEVAATVRSRFDSSGRGDETYILRTAQQSANGIGIDEETCYTLDGAEPPAIAGCLRQNRSGVAYASGAAEENYLIAGTLDSGHGSKRFSNQWIDPGKNFLVCSPADPDGVREATELPGRTHLPMREEPREVCTCADTPRYASLGDAMTVNVMEWIARRILGVGIPERERRGR
jgi:DNA-cytosine methyltransferase